MKCAIQSGLKSNYVGTEYLLLGLIEQHGGMAAQVLSSFGVTIERVREQINKIAGR